MKGTEGRGGNRQSAAHWRAVERLFEAVADLSAAEREATLDRECGGDAELRAAILTLLEADASAPAFLDEGAAAFVAEALDEGAVRDAPGRGPPEGTPPQRVGAYRLLEEIGRGGMSRVFLAEQDDDRLGRQVALKRLVSVGRLREESERRFRAEGRVLAALHHPNIAQVFDAGADDQGDPFLVMELVPGKPITEHCRSRDLGLDRRIDLFLKVCSAVQHAHQRLVIHRDLKPSNILVTDEGLVKLLDFGIAKLLDPELLDDLPDASPTRLGLLPMTPEYAAPEQVRGGEITTATDVYALGLLLYELLTGELPYRIATRSPTELERVICQVDPPSPSTVVARSGTAATPGKGESASVAARWQSRLPGDLDSIALKSLRKAPENRYPSAESLAEDLRRWQRGEPVEARPAGRWVRARKFLRRHRLAVAASTVAILAIVAFGITMAWQQHQTARQRDLARLESRKATEVTEFLLGLFQAGDPAEARGEEITARQLLLRGAARAGALGEQPAVRARLLDVLGRVHGLLGNLDRGEELLREALRIETSVSGSTSLQVAEVQEHLAAVRLEQGAYEEAEALFRSTLDIRRRGLDSDSPELAVAMNNLAVVLGVRDDRAQEAEALLREALDIYRNGDETDPEWLVETLHSLGERLHEQGRYEESEPLLEEARELLLTKLGRDHPRLADVDNALAKLLAKTGRGEAAEPLSRSALELRRRLYGDDHTLVAQSLNDLAVVLERNGDLAAAASTYQQALDAYRSLLGGDHLAVAIIAGNLANLHWLLGDFARSESLARESLEISTSALGPENRYTVRSLTQIALAHHGRGDLEGAESLYREALAMAESLFEPDHPRTGVPMLELGRLLVELGRPREAEDLLRSVHDRRLASLGADHVETARAGAWLGAALAALGKAAEARALLEYALEVHTRQLPERHAYRLETSERFAQLP